MALRNAQLYAQALAAKAEAERANLLRTRLLANASHELRTPVNIILGYSQAAQSDPNPYGVLLPAELRHDLQTSSAAANTWDGWSTTSSTFRRRRSARWKSILHPVDVETCSPKSSNRWRAARARLPWRGGSSCPLALPALHADPVRLRQVLLNLLSNAGNFTDQGHITLGAGVTETSSTFG